MKIFRFALLLLASIPSFAQQLINTTPGQADTAPQGAGKINANFQTLWPLLSLPSNLPQSAGEVLCTPSTNTGAQAAVGCSSLSVTGTYNGAAFTTVMLTCDGATDNYSVIQSAVTTAQNTGAEIVLQPSLYTSPCMVNTSGGAILITKPVRIRGPGMWGGNLELLSGTTHPLFTVNINTANFNPTNGEPAEVDFRDFACTSQNNTDATGLGLAHCIMLINNSLHYHATRVLLENLLIGGVPGNGITCGGNQDGGTGGFDGWVEAHNVIVQYTGSAGYYNNSCTDGRWFGGEIAGAGGTNPCVELSGTAAMMFFGVNIYSCGGYDVDTYHADKTVFDGATIDLTSYANVHVNLTSGQKLTISNSVIRWASTQAATYYGNIDIAGSNAGNLYLLGDDFPTPASSPNTNKAKSNINFISGNTGTVFIDQGTNFDLGAFYTSGAMTGTPIIVSNQNNVLAEWGIPTILPSSGSFANNGVLTLTTALPSASLCTATVGCGMYFPVNTIGSGVAAGVYYTLCSTTTACVVYNNVITGAPAVIASPTAFAVTGPGAYTQTTGSFLTLATLTVPGGALGTNGELIYDCYALRPNNTDAVYLENYLGGSAIGQASAISSTWYGYHRAVKNLGSASSQIVFASANGSTPTDIALNAAGPTYSTINTANSSSLTIQGQLATAATDYLVLLGCKMQLDYVP